MKSSADSGPASCGVLAALLGLAETSEARSLPLPDGSLPRYYSDPRDWKHREQSVAVCFGFLFFAPSGAVMQWLIG